MNKKIEFFNEEIENLKNEYESNCNKLREQFEKSCKNINMIENKYNNLSKLKEDSEINSLKEKITKFENENYNIKSAISQIIEKEEENKKKIDISIQELKILKKRQEKFECLISKDLSSFKQEINNILIYIL